MTPTEKIRSLAQRADVLELNAYELRETRHVLLIRIEGDAMTLVRTMTKEGSREAFEVCELCEHGLRLHPDRHRGGADYYWLLPLMERLMPDAPGLEKVIAWEKAFQAALAELAERFATE